MGCLASAMHAMISKRSIHALLVASGQMPLTFANVAVHDPSVIKVDGTYYIFGSHLAAAKSTDLVDWTGIANGVTAANPLFTDDRRANGHPPAHPSSRPFRERVLDSPRQRGRVRVRHV
jgi:beta-xylosidase